MNLQAKRDAIHERIASMSEDRLDELMPILRNPDFHLSVNEDDSALVAYRMQQKSSRNLDVDSDEDLTEEKSREAFLRSMRKRNEASDLVDRMEKSHVEAVFDLLEETDDGIVLTEEEWAQIERDAELAEKGLIKVHPIEEVLGELRKKIEQLRK
jgi:hypothetical protein